MDNHIKALLKSNENYKDRDLDEEDKEIDLDLYVAKGIIQEVKDKEREGKKEDRSKVFRDTNLEGDEEQDGYEFVRFDIRSLFKQEGESGAFQLVTGLTLVSTTFIFLYNTIKFILKRIILNPTVVRTAEEISLLNLYVKLGTVEILLIVMFVITMCISKKKIKKEERR